MKFSLAIYCVGYYLSFLHNGVSHPQGSSNPDFVIARPKAEAISPVLHIRFVRRVLSFFSRGATCPTVAFGEGGSDEPASEISNFKSHTQRSLPAEMFKGIDKRSTGNLHHPTEWMAHVLNQKNCAGYRHRAYQQNYDNR
jgi:hypothetical protein